MPTKKKARTKKAVKKVEVKVLLPKKIRKRDASLVSFDSNRINTAIGKAIKASQEKNAEKAPEKVTSAVLKDLTAILRTNNRYIPSVEEIQDLVERQLILHRYASAAKAYILYRDKRSELRRGQGSVPDEVKVLTEESKKYFSNQLSEFVYYSTYSKWVDEKGRRETWVETVDRYIENMRDHLGTKLKESEYEDIRENILEMKALGSMRLLWASGKAVKATNVCAYNCSYIAPASWKDMAEIMYVLMCGTGAGFSVEHQNVGKLPMIKKQTGEKLKTHVVGDSKEGWADAFVVGMTTWENGNDIDFDYSQLRPQGARLATMGGRSSGPAPLKSLLEFTRERMLLRQNRRLSTLDVHDIICKIGDIVVMGGVRRSALISLSDLDDIEMREAKNGQFYIANPQRSMANNSAVYNEKPSVKEFLEEWNNLVISGSGERGIFNRGALKKQLPARRWPVFEPDEEDSGTNPCGEIVLKSKQFCNLSEVVCRPDDTEETLMDKVRIATILGTYQASLTNFPYLSKEWKKNCEEEALLGVSLTGQWDSKVVLQKNTLRKLKEIAIETNRKYAHRFGINPSTCITTAKPSGNGSQLFNSSSGMHPRHSKYYIRRIRIERHNPLFMMLKDMGAPFAPEVGTTEENATTFVLEFPVKAPNASERFKDDLSAMDMLEHWKKVKENYTEHNPSTTISVGEDEWLKVGNWVYENWDMVGGLSFLPRSDFVYKLAPYETISKDEYEARAKEFPEIDFSKLVLYEYDDTTTGSKELACTAGTCEIDIPVSSISKNESSIAKK